MTVHSSAGAPVAGGEVRVYPIADARASLAAVERTDALGHARADGLPSGEAWIVVDAPGWARGAAHVVIGDATPDVDFALDVARAITVLVEDERGAPIGGADVEAAGDGVSVPVGARTGADGRAAVGHLGAGPWDVHARAPGYDEGTGRAMTDGATEVVILRRLAALSVHVTAARGEPAAGARVAVAGATLWPPRAAETDAYGDVHIGGLAAGVYALRAVRGDRVSDINLGVSLARGDDRAVELKLQPGRWLVVRVTDGAADDAPAVAAARVTLAEGGLSPFPLEATTDARGQARLGPFAPGPATLDARADGFVSSGAVPAPTDPQVRLVLVRAGTVAGRVVDERGFPIGGASVEIVGTGSNGAPILDEPRRVSFQALHFDAMLGGPAPLMPAGQLGVMPGPVPPIPPAFALADIAGSSPSATEPSVGRAIAPWVSASDGTFRAWPASPGRVRALVRHDDYVDAESETVTLTPGGSAQVTVVMRRGGALQGRVVDDDDRPVAGARLTVAATRGSFERATRSGSDGTFAFASLPSEVSLTAAHEDSSQPEVRLVLTVPDGGRQELTLRLPDPRPPVTVTVTDARGFPVAGAQVSASSLSPDVPLRTTAFTDGAGEAALKRARGLPLRVEASAPGYATRALNADGTADALQIALAPAQSASGEVVTAADEEPVAGAEVMLHAGVRVQRARSDAQGHYTFDDLAEGTATLQVRARGFAPASASVAVPAPSAAVRFDLPRVELTPEGVVEGVVVDAHGEPVVGARVAKDHAPTWLSVGGAVTAAADAVSVTDAQGRFSLRELPEGTFTLEAYAPDVGRGRLDGVRVTAGNTTSGVRIEVAPSPGAGDRESAGPPPAGDVAVTLGETAAPVQVVVVSVAPGSEAERAGVAPGDVLLAVDGAVVRSMEEARARLGGALADDVVLRLSRASGEVTLRVSREPVRR